MCRKCWKKTGHSSFLHLPFFTLIKLEIFCLCTLENNLQVSLLTNSLKIYICCRFSFVNFNENILYEIEGKVAVCLFNAMHIHHVYNIVLFSCINKVLIASNCAYSSAIIEIGRIINIFVCCKKARFVYAFLECHLTSLRKRIMWTHYRVICNNKQVPWHIHFTISFFFSPFNLRRPYMAI